MLSLVLTLKFSPDYPQWQPWFNRYLFDTPGIINRAQRLDWCAALLEWEAGFHLPCVQFLGTAMLPIYPGGGYTPDSDQMILEPTNLHSRGVRESDGEPKYRHALQLPFKSTARHARGYCYHGCVTDKDIRTGLRGQKVLRDAPAWSRISIERMGAMQGSHFGHLMLNAYGSGGVTNAVHLPVQGWKPPFYSDLHATTRSRGRNYQIFDETVGQLWPIVLNACKSMEPARYYFEGVHVDIVPMQVVESMQSACQDLYKVGQMLASAVQATSEGEAENPGGDGRFGVTRDSLTQISADIKKWFEDKVQKWEGTLIPFSQGGNQWFNDTQTSTGYEVLGEGLSRLAPIFYVDWLGIKGGDPGYSGFSPEPDVVELAL